MNIAIADILFQPKDLIGGASRRQPDNCLGRGEASSRWLRSSGAERRSASCWVRVNDVIDSSDIGSALVIGGGRWARVILSELDGVLAPDTAVTVVNPHASSLMVDWIETRTFARRVEVRADLPAAACAEGNAIAIIANRPAQHVASATETIARGYHVLVEKPLATHALGARDLVERARRSRKALVVGLPFLFAPPIKAFRAALPFAPEQTSELELDWDDPAMEQRHGEVKRPDPSVSLVMDIVPHVWSLLRAIFGMRSEIDMSFSQVAHGGASVEIALKVGTTRGTVRLSRCAPRRRRHLALRAGSSYASLDFAEEPAQARIDDCAPLALAASDDVGRALAHEYRFFLECVAAIRDARPAGPPHPADATVTLEHVDLACALDVELRRHQRDLVRHCITDGTLAGDEEGLTALQGLMAEPLIDAGLATHGGDESIVRLTGALASASCTAR